MPPDGGKRRERRPRLTLESISKTYAGVHAVENVSLDVAAGEIHALVGENGAGKSTLVRVASGATTPDTGQIWVNAAHVEIASPRDAIELGIATIYQNSQLVGQLSVEENLFLGRLPEAYGLGFDRSRMRREARTLLDQVGANVVPRALVATLSTAERQLVQIARALSLSAEILILDEPTAAITPSEAARLFDLLKGLCSRGVAIVFVSHRLREVLEVSDRFTVLRDGSVVSSGLIEETSETRLVRDMVGRELAALEARPPSRNGAAVLSVEKLCGRGFRDVSFSVRAGEIVGMFGLVGSGRTEVLRALFGAEPAQEGRIELRGERYRPNHPSAAIKRGVALVPEDRTREGLVSALSVRENLTLANLPTVTSRGFLRRRREHAVAAMYRESLDIRCASLDAPVTSLSGGNQQKVVIGKWLARAPTLVLLDEPTNGIDVGAKRAVYDLIRLLADDGLAIVMVSSDLPEILALSDRILVMREGRLQGEMFCGDATEEAIMSLATMEVLDR